MARLALAIEDLEADQIPTINLKCFKCHKNLVIKQNGKNGRYFLGCQDWPKCDYVESIKTYSKNQLLLFDDKSKVQNPKNPID